MVFFAGELFEYFLIFQLTTYGETRDEALSTMTKALDSYVIRGK